MMQKKSIFHTASVIFKQVATTLVGGAVRYRIFHRPDQLTPLFRARWRLPCPFSLFTFHCTPAYMASSVTFNHERNHNSTVTLP